MKRYPTLPGAQARLAALVVAIALLPTSAAFGQTITNPSFEANTFAVAPGYISDNSPITGWTADVPTGAGLNPAGGTSQFADTGAIPDGKNVAFITGGTTLSTTIAGLTSGTVYKVTLQANATTNTTPILRVTVDSTDILALTIYTVGGVEPYEYVAFEFKAAGTSAVLGLVNDAGSDQTLLVDNLTIAPSSGKWSVDPWTDDATSGVDTQYVYTHAYSFGTSSSALINGVNFTGVAGVNPSVANKFTIGHMANAYNGDVNNITGGSAALAKDFIYSGANVGSATNENLTLFGLTAGRDYVLTIYTMGWENASTTTRWATFSVNGDRLTINQDQLNDNNGIRISYRYTAGADGTARLNITPINPVNVSIHMYGFSNREAASRNIAPAVTLQPQSTTVAQGVPVTLTVASSGFPIPTYQWRFNGANLSGATTPTNALAQVTPQNAGLYDVIVANSLGSATSVVARVTVGLPMTNASFEADAFVSWPGYSGDNPGGGTGGTPPGPNTPITGWTQGDLAGSGINPIAEGDSPFADNGTIPNGKQVAFLQSDNTLSQTVSGLTVGSQYYLHYYENARTGVTPSLEAQLGGTTAIAAHPVLSVGGGNPYHEMFSDVFTATSTSIDVTFVKSNPSGGDSTVLIDNVAIVPVASGTAPTITTAPVAQQGVVGGTNTFSVRFIGSLPVTYQWLKDGTPIAGATGSALALNNLQGSDEADYSVKITNSGGSVTTTPVHLTVVSVVPTVFGTGLGADGKLLDAGATDPHYKMTVSPDTDFPGPDAVVVNDAWPVQAGVWLLNGPDSKWIAPQADQGTGNAEGDYTYTTTFDLTGFDPAKVKLSGQWAVDNTGTDILINGTSTGNTSAGFNAFSPFTITTGLVAGKNTLVFKVTNLPASPNPTAVRIDLKGILGAGSSSQASLQVTHTGTSVVISWSATPAGQKLQSALDIKGPWTDVTGATSPHTVTATGSQMFFRTSH